MIEGKLMARKEIAQLASELFGEDITIDKVRKNEINWGLKSARTRDLNKRVVRYDRSKVAAAIIAFRDNPPEPEQVKVKKLLPAPKREQPVLKPVRGLKLLLRLKIISKEQATKLLDEAKACRICEREFDGKCRKVVDHCHDTMKVRGVLCFRCNSLLGMANDSSSFLLKAIAYLDSVKPPQLP